MPKQLSSPAKPARYSPYQIKHTPLGLLELPTEIWNDDEFDDVDDSIFFESKLLELVDTPQIDKD